MVISLKNSFFKRFRPQLKLSKNRVIQTLANGKITPILLSKSEEFKQ